MDELKQNIKNTMALAEQYEEAGEKLAIAKSEFVDMEGEIIVSALGMLMKKIYEVVDDWVKVNSEKVDQDKQLGDTIKKSVENVLTAISQKKEPTIEFKPQIKVDIQPIATEISKQNETMIKLLNKLDTGKSDELQRLILAMTQKQIAFLEKGLQQHDYSKQLQLISDAISKNDDKLKELDVKYDQGRIVKVIPIYKNGK